MNAKKLFGSLFIFYASVWSCMAIQPNATIPVNVGVILDADTWIGKLGLSCIHMALSDFYASHGHHKTRLVLNVKDSKAEVIEAASAAVDLIKDVGVKAIIGPQSSGQANFLIEVGDKFQVPILSFSATSPSLTSPERQSPYFFRVAHNDAAQVKAISAIVQAFEWNQVVPIYSQGIYEEDVVLHLIRALQEVNVSVPYQSAISPSATDQQILRELDKLRMMPNRVFLVHASPEFGSRLFTMARDMGMMSQGYVWIMTTKMSNLLTLMNSSVIDSMQGVLGLSSYYLETKDLERFEARWKTKFQQENPSIIGAQMNVLGLWAYDAATALAIAVEKAGFTNLSFRVTNASSNATNFKALGVSQSGPRLGGSLSTIRFKGLAGEFSFVNGEVNFSAFQIINLTGDGKRVVAYWTPHNGLKGKMDTRGWDEQTNRNRLRVGVRINPKYSMNQYMDVQHDPAVNMDNVNRFSIDLFNHIIKLLPYPVPYEFIPYEVSYDQSHPSTFHDDLIRQTFLGKFDAVVGDITIMAKRSLYVDFTMPFTKSGATFIVPAIKGKNKTDAWVFLKPLTWELWLTAGCFFVFIGFVVWVLEHRINKEFWGSPSDQVGTSFWFSFSTLVFAQRERVQSNLARFVVIIWVFVVLILTQSYTANLATQMTVQQLSPVVTDVNLLLKNGDIVGYRHGSYTYTLLQTMGFGEGKLKGYQTTEDCDQLLMRGSQNGGIAAAFDEIPYIKVLLASNCSKYTTIGPTYGTEGFGFAFRRGSPLVADVSRAILNLTVGKNEDAMKAIDQKWFNIDEIRCMQQLSENDTSYKLDLASFQGLFLIAGLASSSALIIHTAMFLYGHRAIFMQFDSNDSLWKKIRTMFRIFFQKCTSFHGSTNGREHISKATSNSHDTDIWMPEVNYAAPPSPPRYLNQVHV